MKTTRHDVEQPPLFMQQLPIDKRGYPVPWFVEWVAGEPEFRAMSPAKLYAAINRKLCWVCGSPLFEEKIFVIGPMCAVNRISSEPPSHRPCAIYSARNCPFLTRPQMIRRKDGLEIKPSPGVMIERNPGVILLWYTRSYTVFNSPRRGPANPGILFELGRAFKTEWYREGRPATRAEVLASIESGLPLLRNAAAQHDGPTGEMLLENQITDAMRLVPRV